MAFSEIELARIDRAVGGLCRRRSPGHQTDQLRLEYRVDGHVVDIFEVREEYGALVGVTDTPVARIRFVRSASEWRLSSLVPDRCHRWCRP